MQAVCGITVKLADAIINPLLALVFAVGLLVFVWGMIEFFWDLGGGGGKEKGRQHMLYGVAGMFVMASAYSIILLISKIVGGKIPC